MIGTPASPSGGEASLSWAADSESHGVRERRFDIDYCGRRVPGVLWSPAVEERPSPLVLLGHGASSSKRQDYVVSMARRLVRHRAFAAAAIDGPVHGDRRHDVRPGAPSTSQLVFLDFAQRWAGDEAMTDEMVADYKATLDSLQQIEGIAEGPAGYWGLSMGTILGLPFVAADDRITVAVLGLMGVTGPTRERIASDAAALTCPVLFLLPWDDELFDRASGLELFEAIGSARKCLHANPGVHGAVPREELSSSEEWIAQHLVGGDPQVPADS